jgi:hypothetical protein
MNSPIKRLPQRSPTGGRLGTALIAINLQILALAGTFPAKQLTMFS